LSPLALCGMISLVAEKPANPGESGGARMAPATVKALDKALHLLELLAGAGRPMGLGEVSRGAGLDPSTAHRLLRTLGARDFVRQEGRGGKYHLGLRAFEIGNAVTYVEQLRQSVRPCLEALTVSAQETSNLAIRDGCDGIYVEQVPGPRFVRAFTEVGRRIPLHCTAVGKVLLAPLQPAELDEFCRRRPLTACTRNTITTRPALDRELSRVREQGFAVDDEEFEPGASCVAAPVFDRAGNVVAGVSTSGPAVRFDPSTVAAFVALVHEAAQDISRRLGFVPINGV